MAKSKELSQLASLLTVDTGQVTLDAKFAATAGTAQTDFVTKSQLEVAVAGKDNTDEITEGTTNLYYTDARARASVSATGSLSYNSSTGVFSYTTPSTSGITEGTNLYYTDSRVASYLTANNYATQSYVGTQLANLVDSSPTTLDTLNELAAALGDDPNFATTTATAIGLKAPSASPSFTGTITSAGDIQQNNATYLKGKLSNGTNTRLFGMNSSNVLYIGSVDADHTGGTLFVKNGVTQAVIDANSKIGFPSTSASKLTVDGNINIYDGRIGYQPDTETFTFGGNTYGHYGMSANTALVGLSGYYGVSIFTGGQQRVKIGGGGGPTRVGINTTTLNQILTVNTPYRTDGASTALATGAIVAGPSSDTPSTSFATNNAIFKIQASDQTNGLQFGVGLSGYTYGVWMQATYDNSSSLGGTDTGTEPILIQPIGGNVGIGRKTALSKLHINTQNSGLGLTIENSASQDTGQTASSSNAGQTNDLITLRAAYGVNPESASNNGMKWGIHFTGFNNDTLNAPGKSAAVYAVSEDPGAGYNRKVGLSFWTSEFDQNYTERVRITGSGRVGINDSNPSETLTVAGNAYFYGHTSFLIESAGGNHTRIHASGNGYGGSSPLILSTDRPPTSDTWFVRGVADYNGDEGGSKYTFKVAFNGAGTFGYADGATGTAENVYTRLAGTSLYNGVSNYGNWGGLLLHSSSNMSSSSRRWLITNALHVNKLAFIRSADATTDPALGYSGGTAGAVTSGTADLVITDAGRVGIGTVGPLNKFQVLDGASGLAFSEWNNGASLWLDGADGDFSGGDYYGIHAANDGSLHLGYAGGYNLSINNNGRVGIGAPAANAKLEVREYGASNGTANETFRVVNVTSGATSCYMYIGASSGADYKVGKNVLGTAGVTDFEIYNTDNTKMISMNANQVAVQRPLKLEAGMYDRYSVALSGTYDAETWYPIMNSNDMYDGGMYVIFVELDTWAAGGGFYAWWACSVPFAWQPGFTNSGNSFVFPAFMGSGHADNGSTFQMRIRQTSGATDGKSYVDIKFPNTVSSLNATAGRNVAIRFRKIA